jgi:hypothetical protein
MRAIWWCTAVSDGPVVRAQLHTPLERATSMETRGLARICLPETALRFW